MNPADAAYLATTTSLERLSSIDAESVVQGAYWWMQSHSAGIPLASLALEDARNQALYWSDTATTIELECYMIAALRALTPDCRKMHSKQIKRIFPPLWKALSKAEQEAFLSWAEKNKNED